MAEPVANLFGDIAVERGYITEEQLSECLGEYEKLVKGGQKVQLGQIMVRKNYISVAQFVEILKLQDKEILRCPSCNIRYNADRASTGKRRCKQCGILLVVDTRMDSPIVDSSFTPSDDKGVIATREVSVGQKIGKYLVVKELGRGGMGTVCEAKDTVLGRQVALKILHQGAPPVVLERFMREAKLIANLDHHNIVKIFEVVAEEGLHYFAMELIKGDGFDTLLARKKVTLKESVAIVEQVARAMHYAHEKGIIHRDIKPSNVMLDEKGRAVLMDFGIARLESAEDRLTKTGTIIGTPYYMSPEQVQGAPLDPRTDIYSLGIVLYEAIVGRIPFTGKTEAEIYQKIVLDDPERPKSVKPYIDDELEAVIMKAIQKEKGDRYGTAEEFAEDLKNYLAGNPVTASSGTFTRTIVSKIKRSKPIKFTIAALLLLLVGGASSFYLFKHEETPAVVDTKKPQIDEMLRQAQADEKNGKLQEAITTLDNLLKIDPENSTAKMIRANLITKRELADLDRLLKDIEPLCSAKMSEGTLKTVAAKFAEARLLASRYGKNIDSLCRRIYGIGQLSILHAWECAAVNFLPARLCSTPSNLRTGTNILTVIGETPGVRFPLLLERQPDGSGESVTIDAGVSTKKGFVLVPAGKFLTGDDQKVASMPAFSISQFEMTNAELQPMLDGIPSINERLMFTPASFRGLTPADSEGEMPVCGIGAVQTSLIVLQLGYRIPYLSEWEKAARGTDGRTYPWGNEKGLLDYVCGNTGRRSENTLDISPYGIVNLVSGSAEWVTDERFHGLFNGIVPTGGHRRFAEEPGGYSIYSITNKVKLSKVPDYVGIRVALTSSPGESPADITKIFAEGDAGTRHSMLSGISAALTNEAANELISRLKDEEDLSVLWAAYRCLRRSFSTLEEFLSRSPAPRTIERKIPLFMLLYFLDGDKRAQDKLFTLVSEETDRDAKVEAMCLLMLTGDARAHGIYRDMKKPEGSGWQRQVIKDFVTRVSFRDAFIEALRKNLSYIDRNDLEEFLYDAKTIRVIRDDKELIRFMESLVKVADSRIKETPELTDLYASRGLYYLVLNKPVEAEADFKKLVDSKSKENRIFGHKLLAISAASAGKGGQAVACCDNALKEMEAHSEPEKIVNGKIFRAALMTNAGDGGAAVQILKEVDPPDNSKLEYFWVMAHAASSAGDVKSAKDWAKKALGQLYVRQTDPEWKGFLLGLKFLGMNDEEKMYEIYRR